MHHLRKHKYILQTMRDLLGNELHKIRYKLVKPRVLLETGIGGGPVILARLVQKCIAHFLKVQLKLLRHDMLDERFHSHIARATHSGQSGIRIRTLGHQFQIAGVGRRRILRDGWLYTFDS